MLIETDQTQKCIYCTIHLNEILEQKKLINGQKKKSEQLPSSGEKAKDDWEEA